MDREVKERELQELRARAQQLEAELAQAEPSEWPPRSYYTAYHVLAGFVLGAFGAAASLIFNIVGSLLVHQSPLRLIEIYLTFPLGQKWADAIGLTEGVARSAEPSSLALAVGCCLYLATGMLLGIPFHLVLSRWLSNSTFTVRFIVVSVLALAIWLINFYGILSWLQPLLFGGRWIVDFIPFWVAALTHLVFGWTMILVQPFGVFIARPNPVEGT